MAGNEMKFLVHRDFDICSNKTFYTHTPVPWAALLHSCTAACLHLCISAPPDCCIDRQWISSRKPCSWSLERLHVNCRQKLKILQIIVCSREPRRLSWMAEHHSHPLHLGSPISPADGLRPIKRTSTCFSCFISFFVLSMNR